MDYTTVYTFYGMLHAGLIVLCILFSAAFNGYLVTRARFGRQLWTYLSVQMVLLVWLVVKILTFTAPEPVLVDRYQWIQRFLAAVLMLLLMGVLYSLYRQKTDRKIQVLFIAIIAAIGGAVLYDRLSVSGYTTDFVPVVSFILFNGFVFLYRRRIFIELSALSIDMFMESLEDGVMIFDRSGALIDYNQNAIQLTGPFEAGETLTSFLHKLQTADKSGHIQMFETDFPVEIFLSGERYYWLQKTVSTDRGGNPIATVFLCRNVTERTLRLRELSDKNDELDQLNAELENYIEVAALLEEEREKSRVARDMQQTLLKRITRIESELQTLQKKCCEDEDVILKQLDVLTESGRETMADIRSTVEKLVRPEDAKERWDEAKDDLEG